MSPTNEHSAGPGDAIGDRLTKSNAEVFERVKEVLLEQARPAPGRKTATIKFSVELLGAIVESFGVASIAATREIARLERRLAEVESRKSLEYRGIWKAGESYERGDFVSYRGSMWACCAPTSGYAPGEVGEGSACFQLAVKKGRDSHRDNRGVQHHDE